MRSILAAIVFALSLLGSAKAHAYTLELAPSTCAAGADSMEEAFALPPERLDCGENRFASRAPFVRTSTMLDGRKLAIGSGLVWQTRAADFRSLLVRFTYADGTSRLVDVDPQMAARNWFVGNRFSVPVPASSAALVAVDTVVERPFTRSLSSESRIMTNADRAREHYHRSLAYMFLLGLLVLPLLYDFLFYRVLRQSFVLWHVGMIGATSLYMLAHSGLVFEILPDLALGVRWRLISLALALAAACAAMVVAGLIEEKYLPPRTTRAMVAVAFLPLAVKAVATLANGALRLTINDWFVFSFMPVVVLIGAVTAIALAKGSRGARWALASMAMLVLVMALRVLVALTDVELPVAMADLVFAGFVLLSLVTAVAVGDRFTGLKEDRDAANVRAVKLGRMARTDGLTGLANRRAFDTIKRLRIGQGLLVADIDHFKLINDRHGHQTGDAVLCHVADVLRIGLSDGTKGRVFRLGGEEFALVVEAMEQGELVAVGERLREAIGRTMGTEEAPELPPVTVSMGAVLGEGQAMHAAFGQADRALYRAKNDGRDCVRLADGEDVMPMGGPLAVASLTGGAGAPEAG